MLQSWSILKTFYRQFHPDTITTVQLMMGVYETDSENIRLSCQELFKRLVNDKKLNASEWVKELVDFAKLSEADDHLQAQLLEEEDTIKRNLS